MRTKQKLFTAAAALLVAVVVGAPVIADCGANPAVISSAGPLGQSQLWNPNFSADATFFYGSFGGTTYCGGYNGCTPVSPNVAASFWRQGAGDVALGAGNDSGAFDLVAAGGIYWASYPSVGYYGGAYLNTGWQPGTDGCIDGGNCLCMLVTDSDADNAFFAILGAQSDATFVSTLEQGGSDGSGNFNAPIILSPVTKPSINGSTRVGTDVQLDVSVGAQGGVYMKDGCNCGPTGYRVLQQILPRGNMPPTDRSAGWANASAITPIGMPVSVTATCGAADQDVYLATELFFDSDFSTSIVSANSSRVECGTNLADPDDRPRQRPSGIKPGRNNAPRGGRGR